MTKTEYEQDIIKRYGTQLLKKNQAASELQVSEMTIDRLRKSGELKSKKVGGIIRIPASSVAEFLAV